MEEKVNSCPVCGGPQLRRKELDLKVSAPYGSAVPYKAVYYSCASCGEEGDYSGETEKNQTAAYLEAAKNSAASMIESLCVERSQAYIERALELPPKTLIRWKAGEVSAPALALLRSLKTFPWLIELADSQYDQLTARKLVLDQARSIFEEMLARQYVPKSAVNVESASINKVAISQKEAKTSTDKNESHTFRFSLDPV